VFVHLFEQYLAEAMTFEKVSELPDGGFIRQASQLQANEVVQ
jgi:hypothetical protein